MVRRADIEGGRAPREREKGGQGKERRQHRALHHPQFLARISQRNLLTCPCSSSVRRGGRGQAVDVYAPAHSPEALRCAPPLPQMPRRLRKSSATGSAASSPRSAIARGQSVQSQRRQARARWKRGERRRERTVDPVSVPRVYLPSLCVRLDVHDLPPSLERRLRRLDIPVVHPGPRAAVVVVQLRVRRRDVEEEVARLFGGAPACRVRGVRCVGVAGGDSLGPGGEEVVQRGQPRGRRGAVPACVVRALLGRPWEGSVRRSPDGATRDGKQRTVETVKESKLTMVSQLTSASRKGSQRNSCSSHSVSEWL